VRAGGLKLDKVAAQPAAALGAGDVALKILASPIHKADLQAIASAESKTAPLGIEGLAEVTEVGSAVKSLQKGDRVVPPLGFGE